MSDRVEKSLTEIDFTKLLERKFTPSPAAWEDQVLYFLMLDRFSDGREAGGHKDNRDKAATGGTTPLWTPDDPGSVDYKQWLSGSGGWQGGTLAGLQSKLGYLRRLGITAIWISPVFRQVAFQATYHGYGIQNFLDVDPHFGTREELRDFVAAAHAQGIYVILDIILNHAGDVFSYAENRYMTKDAATGQWVADQRWDGSPYQVAGFNDSAGKPSIGFDPPDRAALDAAWPDGAVWPREFQQPRFFHRKGRIDNWDYSPEFLEGDFCSLKAFDLTADTSGRWPKASPALMALSIVYSYWIAYADIDGFRIDTVKHMGKHATRYFCERIHEFTQMIGKERFLLAGEITGGRANAWDMVEKAGLDAALGVDDLPLKVEQAVKGYCDPAEYFDMFRNSLLDEHSGFAWYRSKIIKMFDDHDQVCKGLGKRRFCGETTLRGLVFNALAMELTTMGIPCIYYGTEQEFDSGARPSPDDVVLRENMFGGNFGGKCSRGRHFFNESTQLFKDIAELCRLRKESMLLRRGRQVLAMTSGDGTNFGLPHVIGERMKGIFAWSRVFGSREVLLATTTDESGTTGTWCTVSPMQLLGKDRFRLVFCHGGERCGALPGTLDVELRSGMPCVQLTVPPAGFVMYEAQGALDTIREFTQKHLVA